MPKELWKALPLGVGVVMIGLIVGCPSGGGDATPTTVEADPPKDTTIPKGKKTIPSGPKPMLDGWQTPALILVLSGEQHGYMEPCGCSVTQSGGLSRRADFFRQLQDKGWTITALDLGGLVRKDNLQNKFKFQEMLHALKDLGYKGMAIGKEELALERLEPGFLLIQGKQLQIDGDSPFLCANVEFTQFKGENGRDDVARPTRLIAAGGRKVGVAAVFGKKFRTELFGSGADPNIAFKEPEQVLPAALDALKKEHPDFLVLLSHATREESIALARKFPDFQVVVTADGPEDGNETPERVGKTLLIDVGQKGKHIGVLGFYPENTQEPFRFELVDLDKERFKDTPSMIERMRAYQQMLQSSYDDVLKDLPKVPHPNGEQFAGVESCKDCHKKAYGVWKDSGHANAYASLITGREGAKNVVPRNHDPECLACHVTGWEPQQVFPYVSGFYSEEKTPGLKNQQCENCHGPAATHVQLELAWKKDPKSVKPADRTSARDKVKLTLAAAKNVCYRCHDLDNDPHFNFPEYWERVKHPGRD